MSSINAAAAMEQLRAQPGTLAVIAQDNRGWVARVERPSPTGAEVVAVWRLDRVTAEHELRLARDGRAAHAILHELAS